MNKHSNTKTESVGLVRFVRPVSCSILFGIIISSVIMLLISVVLTVRDIPQSFVNPLAVTAVCIGSFLAGYVCSKLIKQKGLFFGFVCGFVIFMIIVLAGLIVQSDKMGILMLYKFLSIVSAGMLGGVIGVNTKKRYK